MGDYLLGVDNLLDYVRPDTRLFAAHRDLLADPVPKGIPETTVADLEDLQATTATDPRWRGGRSGRLSRRVHGERERGALGESALDAGLGALLHRVAPGTHLGGD